MMMHSDNCRAVSVVMRRKKYWPIRPAVRRQTASAATFQTEQFKAGDTRESAVIFIIITNDSKAGTSGSQTLSPKETGVLCHHGSRETRGFPAWRIVGLFDLSFPTG